MNVAIVGFLRAHIRGTRYLYDSANREDVIDILVRHTRATSQIAAATYDLEASRQ